MSLLFIDIETYSSTDLRGANVYRYSEDPEFQILMAAYATEDDAMMGQVHVAIGEDAVRAIPGLWDPRVTKVAHNAPFERICFSRLTGLPVGKYLSVAEWEDTMALAAEWGYPQSLKDLAVALGAEDKDDAGTRLINLFCKPNRQGKQVRPEDKPAEWQAFVEYCRQDVATLVDVYYKLIDKYGGWPTATERAVWEADQRINDKGIPTDVLMADEAVAAAEANKEEQLAEMAQLTGLDNPNSNVQLLGWLQESGMAVQDLKAATVTAALAQDDLTDVQRRVLQLRQELALVASKKYIAALDKVSGDGRLRGSFQFFGAHTGRWAGRGVQLQNLPSASLDSEVMTEAAIMDLMLGNGASAHTLKALVRALFVGPFTVVDYSAIEARVIAWLAGEQWALDAFAGGRDIYVETASRMFHLDYEAAQARRKQGKVAVLALGYNGGIGSLQAMGADGSRDELQFLVNQWRDANPSIVGLWAQLEQAFRVGGQVGDHLSVEKDGKDRLIRLPSGRAIVYHNCGLQWETDDYGRKRQRITFSDPKKRGLRTGTYGGRLSENVTQAVARDVLAEALLRLHKWGYGLVGHVHDEILVHGVGTRSVQAVSTIMTELPTWAAGLPVDAEGFTCARYRKG